MSKRKIEFMSLLEDYFETYLPYSRGLSPNTIESYHVVTPIYVGC